MRAFDEVNWDREVYREQYLIEVALAVYVFLVSVTKNRVISLNIFLRQVHRYLLEK